MALTVAAKDPDEKVDYSWSPALDDGDTITGAVSATVLSGGITLDSISTVDDIAVKFVVSGGTLGAIGAIQARVSTVGGRIWEETLYIPIVSSAVSALAASLIVNFPAFAAVPVGQIGYWLDRAIEITGEWGNDHATILLACHYMTLNGLGTGTAAELNAQGLVGVKSLKSGSLSLDFGDNAASVAKGGYDSTNYGRQFYPLLLAQVAGPRITPTGCPDFTPAGFPWGS